MRFFRVFPWLADARAGQPGHPLYVPSLQGAGRIDNPEYRTLYVSDSPVGAVAEAFGNHAVWTAELLAGPPALPESLRALVAYEADVAVLDLDDARVLVARDLRPSDVVIRDLLITQAWARKAHDENRWDGIRWWSYHDARWHSFGFWNLDRVHVDDVTPLAAGHPALVDARAALSRPWAE